MAEMLGADIESLVGAADEFIRVSRRLDEVRNDLSGSVRAATWVGNEADDFRRDWAGRVSPLLEGAANCLANAEAKLRRQAEDQSRASEAYAPTAPLGASSVPRSALVPLDALTAQEKAAVAADWAEFLYTGNNMPTPYEIAERWSSLSPEEQRAIEDLRPDLLRNLDGIPYSVRGELNFAYLEEERSTHNCDGRGGGDGVCSSLDPLYQKLFDGEGHRITSRNVVLLDLDTYPDRPLAAVSEGDVDHAQYVVVRANGLNSTVASMGGDIDYLHDSRAKALQYMRLHGDEDGQYAVISYQAYKAPQLTIANDVGGDGNVLQKGFSVVGDLVSGQTAWELANPDTSVVQGHLAEEGAPGFGKFLTGVRAVNPDTELTMNVYSYGTTLGADTARLLPSGFLDHIVAVESPGMGDVNAIHTGDGRGVVVVEVPNDLVADAGSVTGSDPNQAVPAGNVASTSPRSPSLETNNMPTTQEGGHAGGNAIGSTAQYVQIWTSLGVAAPSAVSRGDDYGDVLIPAALASALGPFRP